MGGILKDGAESFEAEGIVRNKDKNKKSQKWVWVAQWWSICLAYIEALGLITSTTKRKRKKKPQKKRTYFVDHLMKFKLFFCIKNVLNYYTDIENYNLSRIFRV